MNIILIRYADKVKILDIDNNAIKVINQLASKYSIEIATNKSIKLNYSGIIINNNAVGYRDTTINYNDLPNNANLFDLWR